MVGPVYNPCLLEPPCWTVDYLNNVVYKGSGQGIHDGWPSIYSMSDTQTITIRRVIVSASLYGRTSTQSVGMYTLWICMWVCVLVSMHVYTCTWPDYIDYHVCGLTRKHMMASSSIVPQRVNEQMQMSEYDIVCMSTVKYAWFITEICLSYNVHIKCLASVTDVCQSMVQGVLCSVMLSFVV